MKIVTTWNERRYYYVTTSNGRAVIGQRSAAADLPADLVERVLAHLKQIDHRFANAEVEQ